MIYKACPVALHPDGAPRRVPVFEHPLAGLQLVKGTVRAGEDPTRAAARELFEESGLETRAAIPLGQSDGIVAGERWHFALCRIAPPVRERWQHHCADDGGHLFKFHWIALDEPSDLPAPFDAALAQMRALL
ncbi:NUDIX domain-containing protein [Litoreibacter ponti]|uniref:NUDIX domain-containing protein n=1 Tax=Litoreibacter ponti TaxID=1510457 RepID=A0A2T6BMM8_9RHOB|nr:NUDIX domain-containing protein [Litoreibacter ponti]PTX57316.1 NUDIX domain-containing protein [Litoreibacter ponti]